MAIALRTSAPARGKNWDSAMAYSHLSRGVGNVLGSTAKGLAVVTTVLDKVYETGKKATDELKASIQIVFDDVLPKWNYTALANLAQIGSTI